jgi:hypothetical protein
MEYHKIELEILNKMFSYKNKNYKNILEQIKNSTVKSRESSTA